MKVTVEEAAKRMKCSTTNVYQQLKFHGIQTETEIKEVEYLTTRRVKRKVFELEDLIRKREALT